MGQGCPDPARRGHIQTGKRSSHQGHLLQSPSVFVELQPQLISHITYIPWPFVYFKKVLSFPTGFILTETHRSHCLPGWRSLRREGLSGARSVSPLPCPTPQSRSSTAPWQVTEANVTGTSHGDAVCFVRCHEKGICIWSPHPITCLIMRETPDRSPSRDSL